jgi:AP-1 complex subunit mu
MSCSAIFILDSKGRVLISRNYRGDVAMSVATRFATRLLEEEESSLKPIVNEEGVTYVFVKHNNLYFLALSDRNINVSVTLLFLYKLIETLTVYFEEVCEESIRDNFVVIYELVDEMMDFGYPQVTDPKILQNYITQESHKLEEAVSKAPQILKTVTGAVSWRPEGIKYRKNEVFLDVIESVNLLVSSTGQVLRSEIVGSIKMKVQLSGMPELRLGLNDKVQLDRTSTGQAQKDAAASSAATASGTSGGTSTGATRKAIEMEDVNFHQCVRLTRFETNHAISFVPPDGEFELMSYRLTTHVRPLIWIEAIIDKHEHSRVEYLIKAKSQFKTASTANNVAITIPVPPDSHSPKFRCNVGSCDYAPEKDCMVWQIKQFPGGKEFLMRAHFDLPSIVSQEKSEKKKPIQVAFEIPYFTVSGIQVRYLKIIEKSGYQAMPWVRYITNSGDYQIRT